MLSSVHCHKGLSTVLEHHDGMQDMRALRSAFKGRSYLRMGFRCAHASANNLPTLNLLIIHRQYISHPLERVSKKRWMFSHAGQLFGHAKKNALPEKLRMLAFAGIFEHWMPYLRGPEFRSLSRDMRVSGSKLCLIRRR